MLKTLSIFIPQPTYFNKLTSTKQYSKNNFIIKNNFKMNVSFKLFEKYQIE